MGERAGGEAGLNALTRAVEAYEAALEVHTRTEMPADWAKTQNNLASALRVMGERAGGEAGLNALTRAVEAYEAALEVRTRTEMPADWANSMSGLGSARIALGIGSADANLTRAGIGAIENALETYRTVVPEDEVESVLQARAQGINYLRASGS